MLTLQPATATVDPVTFEIISHRLYQITREMGATLERVGGTVNTTQMKDYMAALYRATADMVQLAMRRTTASVRHCARLRPTVLNAISKDRSL